MKCELCGCERRESFYKFHDSGPCAKNLKRQLDAALERVKELESGLEAKRYSPVVPFRTNAIAGDQQQRGLI
jgi:NAD+--asparagine ADP-ribosyltransferase